MKPDERTEGRQVDLGPYRRDSAPERAEYDKSSILACRPINHVEIMLAKA